MAVRVGFVGAGYIATQHSKLLRFSGAEHERAGVFDLEGARAESFVAAAGGRVAGSVDEVLASSDAVFVCTWTSAHEDVVAAAVDAGVAVFVEKPLGTDLASARRLAGLLDGVPHQVGLVLHHSPAFALLRSLLEDRDRTGRVMSVVFRDDQVLPVGGRYASDWRVDPDRAGSGVLLEHSIHDVDLLDRLVGPITSVAGRQRCFHGVEGIEDLVVASLELEGGGVGTLTTVWHDLQVRNSLRYLEVVCERAFATVENDWFGPVRLTTQEATQEWADEALLEECGRRGISTELPEAAFVHGVAAGASLWPTADVAVRAHELVDAIYRSAATGGSPISV